MNPLHIVQGFDTELSDYFEKELEHQHFSLSFIPDENCISPSCAGMMGNVLINSTHQAAFKTNLSLESIAKKRLCELFGAEHANVSTITIEAASRVVFQALTERGDVVMSLDLRKREHCNSEAFAYRFVNFGVDPNTQRLDLNAIGKEIQDKKPRLIILSPINYPLSIDYERFAQIAHDNGALLWCDVSQVASLIAAGTISSPLPHADVVTFNFNGALQGPRCSVILCKQQFASAIDRICVSSGHSGLGSMELAALSLRLKEMSAENFVKYATAVKENAQALAEGLKASGVKLICDSTETHLVIIDDKSCAMSARGALEGLAECGILVRACQVHTEDSDIKFDGIRLSSMPITTRGMKKDQVRKVGEAIGKYLIAPNEDNENALQRLVREYTVILPIFWAGWLPEGMYENLDEDHLLETNAEFLSTSLTSSHGDIRKRKNRLFEVIRRHRKES